jgi:glycosyltransferase involved in cell wall biosynthesis
VRISIVTGIVVDHDAISGSVVWQARELAKLPEIEEVAVFALHFERSDLQQHYQVGSAWALLRHPFFATSDIVVFHFGVRYSLFSALHHLSLLDRRPVLVVHYHNVTPPRLVPLSDQETQLESLAQAELIADTDRVWAVSEFNRTDLITMGVREENIRVMPIPVELPKVQAGDEIRTTKRVLYVGRIVPAKGVECLLDAFEVVAANESRPCELVIAGNSSLSDDSYVSMLHQRVQSSPTLRRTVSFRSQPSDAELWELYMTSDVFATATHHEGLCLPIVEAAIAGCFIAATSAGNIPFLMDGGALADVGDHKHLARAITEALQKLPAYRPSQSVLDKHSPLSVIEVMQEEIRDLGRARASKDERFARNNSPTIEDVT